MIRLTLLVALLLISTLAVFKAPTYHLWLLAIVVTEYPAIFMIGTGLILLTGFWTSRWPYIEAVVGLAALMLFASPIYRAYRVSVSLPDQLEKAFGPVTQAEPLSFIRLLQPDSSDVVPQRFVYTKDERPDLSMDFYPSQISGKRPCVIVIHGGSWSSGDSEQLPELNSYLANTGYHVAAINYRLAPAHQSPAPINDVAKALHFLRQQADKLLIDTSSVILLGRSAGAQIALLAAYRLKDPSVKGVIDFYGPADMVWGYSLPANPWVMDSKLVMENYLGGKYNEVPGNFKDASPLNYITPASVPTLIIHGANDVLVAYDHSRRLAEKLEQNGVRHFWLKLPWATHGFDYNLNGPGGQLSTYTVGVFLNSVTKHNQ